MPKKVSRSGVREIKDEEKKARIAFLQSEVARLEREVAIQEERLKHSIQRYKEAEEQSKGTVARYLFCKEEDLTLEELQEYFQELSRVQKEVAEQLSLGVPAVNSHNLLCNIKIRNRIHTTCVPGPVDGHVLLVDGFPLIFNK
jgi:uncharacterized small protein (DUF1192 family)